MIQYNDFTIGRFYEVMELLQVSDLTLRAEIAWILAFATAKDDAPLQEFISKGLFEVRIFPANFNSIVSRHFI